MKISTTNSAVTSSPDWLSRRGGDAWFLSDSDLSGEFSTFMTGRGRLDLLRIVALAREIGKNLANFSAPPILFKAPPVAPEPSLSKEMARVLGAENLKDYFSSAINPNDPPPPSPLETLPGGLDSIEAALKAVNEALAACERAAATDPRRRASVRAELLNLKKCLLRARQLSPIFKEQCQLWFEESKTLFEEAKNLAGASEIALTPLEELRDPDKVNFASGQSLTALSTKLRQSLSNHSQLVKRRLKWLAELKDFNEELESLSAAASRSEGLLERWDEALDKLNVRFAEFDSLNKELTESLDLSLKETENNLKALEALELALSGPQNNHKRERAELLTERLESLYRSTLGRRRDLARCWFYLPSLVGRPQFLNSVFLYSAVNLGRAQALIEETQGSLNRLSGRVSSTCQVRAAAKAAMEAKDGSRRFNLSLASAKRRLKNLTALIGNRRRIESINSELNLLKNDGERLTRDLESRREENSNLRASLESLSQKYSQALKILARRPLVPALSADFSQEQTKTLEQTQNLDQYQVKTQEKNLSLTEKDDQAILDEPNLPKSSFEVLEIAPLNELASLTLETNQDNDSELDLPLPDWASTNGHAPNDIEKEPLFPEEPLNNLKFESRENYDPSENFEPRPIDPSKAHPAALASETHLSQAQQEQAQTVESSLVTPLNLASPAALLGSNERLTLQIKAVSLERDRLVEELVDAREALVEAAHQKLAALKQAQRVKEDLKKTEVDRDSLLSQIDNIRQEQVEFKARGLDLAKLLKESRNELIEFKKRFDELAEREQVSREEAQLYQHRKEELEALVLKLKDDIKLLNEEKSKEQERLSQLAARIEGLNSSEAALKAELIDRKEELISVDKARAQLSEVVSAVRTQLDRMIMVHNALKASWRARGRSLVESQAEGERLKHGLDRHKRALVTLATKRQALLAQLGENRLRAKSLESLRDSLKEEIDKLKEDANQRLDNFNQELSLAKEEAQSHKEKAQGLNEELDKLKKEMDEDLRPLINVMALCLWRGQAQLTAAESSIEKRLNDERQQALAKQAGIRVAAAAKEIDYLELLESRDRVLGEAMAERDALKEEFDQLSKNNDEGQERLNKSALTVEKLSRALNASQLRSERLHQGVRAL
ncbi:MAG: hypothetical protein LBV23_02420, partial [Deltaproteobacteria bacterium]|nr:hypothetical protein [Deltaproteobacteria bacterium]